ncbi:MAG: hypothetical protein ACE5GA_06725, partial [Candidatus Zixiibacteriota bacterium]
MKKLVMSALALLAISFQPSALRATTIDFSVSAAAINDNVGFGPYRQAGWTFSLEGRTKIDQADPQANPFVAGVAGTVYLGDLGNLGVDQASYFCLGVQSDEPKSKEGQNDGFGGSKGISGEGKHQDEA